MQKKKEEEDKRKKKRYLWKIKGIDIVKKEKGGVPLNIMLVWEKNLEQ